MRFYIWLLLMNLVSAMNAGAQQHNLTSSPSYESISPSALALIRLKAHTHIPFATESAAMLTHHPNPDFASAKVDFRKLIHFENRYWTIDTMLEFFPSTNILEFSSGYSFRGLALCKQQKITFIDTDLPDLIKTKQVLVDSLINKDNLVPRGTLLLLPLNVFDLKAFQATVSKFPEGPVTIINEGLLPYFKEEEKRKLCNNIHSILKERGGYWITADVYIKDTTEIKDDNEHAAKFRKEHGLDENRFESFEEAELFFNECGFIVVRRETFSIDKLSCLRLVSPDRREAIINKLKTGVSTRQTWCLKVKE